MKNNIRAFIFARGGSKGIHKKNLQKINNIPLIGHSINIANAIDFVDKVYVSTDCEEIGDTSKKYGAEVIYRPKYLATDNSPELLSWKHAINYSIKNDDEFNIFLSLPPTAPLRDIEDVLKCIDSLSENVDIVLTMTKSKKSPWFNMVYKNEDNKISLLNKNLSITRRQESPECFDPTTVAYAAKKDFIQNTESIWEGKVVGVEIPEERAIDIDSSLDLKVASYLYKKRYP